jgi:rhodanese-related sulfurtransferase
LVALSLLSGRSATAFRRARNSQPEFKPRKSSPVRFKACTPDSISSQPFASPGGSARAARHTAAAHSIQTVKRHNIIHTMKKLVALALALFAGSLMAAEYPDISIADLKKAIAEGKVAVIDVNGSGSFQKGRVPTAIDFQSEADNLSAKLPEDKSTLVVAYCGGPSCSAYKRAAKKAEELGYTNVKHLSAGISGWKAAGEELEK